MPKAAPKQPSANTSARLEPYARFSSEFNDKENVDPSSNKPKPSSSKFKSTKPKKDSPEANGIDWRDIKLETAKGEVPCYDNAATVRRKLKHLINSKDTIPGSTKKWVL